MTSSLTKAFQQEQDDNMRAQLLYLAVNGHAQEFEIILGLLHRMLTVKESFEFQSQKMAKEWIIHFKPATSVSLNDPRLKPEQITNIDMVLSQIKEASHEAQDLAQKLINFHLSVYFEYKDEMDRELDDPAVTASFGDYPVLLPRRS